jgi:L-alanine-DL-glutamate epimerase-like enolase superfamily enzyme
MSTSRENKKQNTKDADGKVSIDTLNVSAYKIPTDTPESDGTIAWNSTTLVLVEIEAGGKSAIGYSYTDAATAYFIEHSLKNLVVGHNVLQHTAITQSLINSVRNNGNCGTSMMAVAAIDNALWDLKAKLFEVPLCSLLGKVHDKMLLYGSGGFTSYSDKQTSEQFENWAMQGITHFKMKVGREPDKDKHRVKEARKVIGDAAKLFVDANGAYTVKQALEKAKEFSHFNVTWFEEPVTSDNLKGLKFIKEYAPVEINIAAGEYGYNLPYFENMLDAEAVDILQADATRCGGITNFLKAGHLCEARQLPFSSHCAPSQHLHAALAVSAFYIAEYFYDHARIEKLLFDGCIAPKHGYIKPDESRPGIGLVFKHRAAEKYKIKF